VGTDLSASAFCGMDERSQEVMIELLQRVRQNLSPAGTDGPLSATPILGVEG